MNDMKFRELNVGDWFVMDNIKWEKVEYPAWSGASAMCLEKDNFGHVYPQRNLDKEVDFLPKLDYCHSHFHATGHNVFNEKVFMSEAIYGLPLKSATAHEIYAKTRYNSTSVYIVIYSDDAERQGLTFPVDDKKPMWVRECLELHLNFDEWSCGK